MVKIQPFFDGRQVVKKGHTIYFIRRSFFQSDQPGTPPHLTVPTRQELPYGEITPVMVPGGGDPAQQLAIDTFGAENIVPLPQFMRDDGKLVDFEAIDVFYGNQIERLVQMQVNDGRISFRIVQRHHEPSGPIYPAPSLISETVEEITEHSGVKRVYHPAPAGPSKGTGAPRKSAGAPGSSSAVSIAPRKGSHSKGRLSIGAPRKGPPPRTVSRNDPGAGSSRPDTSVPLQGVRRPGHKQTSTADEGTTIASRTRSHDRRTSESSQDDPSTTTRSTGPRTRYSSQSSQDDAPTMSRGSLFRNRYSSQSSQGGSDLEPVHGGTGRKWMPRIELSNRRFKEQQRQNPPPAPIPDDEDDVQEIEEPGSPPPSPFLSSSPGSSVGPELDHVISSPLPMSPQEHFDIAEAQEGMEIQVIGEQVDPEVFIHDNPNNGGPPQWLPPPQLPQQPGQGAQPEQQQPGQGQQQPMSSGEDDFNVALDFVERENLAEIGIDPDAFEEIDPNAFEDIAPTEPMDMDDFNVKPLSESGSSSPTQPPAVIDISDDELPPSPAPSSAPSSAVKNQPSTSEPVDISSDSDLGPSASASSNQSPPSTGGTPPPAGRTPPPAGRTPPPAGQSPHPVSPINVLAEGPLVLPAPVAEQVASQAGSSVSSGGGSSLGAEPISSDGFSSGNDDNNNGGNGGNHD